MATDQYLVFYGAESDEAVGPFMPPSETIAWQNHKPASWYGEQPTPSVRRLDVISEQQPQQLQEWERVRETRLADPDEL